MKKILGNIKSWLVIWLTIIITLICWWLLYASLTFQDLHEVNGWDTLTSQKWNEMVTAINSIKSEINTISSSLDTLSGTVYSISLSTPTAPSSYDVVYDWKYYKSFWATKMNWDNAFGSTASGAVLNGCLSLWKGWKLPDMSELRELYRAKTAEPSHFTALNLQSGRYWSNDSFWSDSYYRSALILNMSNGARDNFPKTDNGYVVCVHD
jgi:hypothetical protein